jgi:hypothetical protein
VKTWRSLLLGLAVASLWLSACGKPAASGPPPPSPPTPEQSKITRLMGEITEMTRPRGCATSKECKTVGVGYGGCAPRQYIVYCPRNVEEALLQQRLDELSKLEQAEAEHQGEPPPCRPPATPEPEVFEGACRAKL